MSSAARSLVPLGALIGALLAAAACGSEAPTRAPGAASGATSGAASTAGGARAAPVAVREGSVVVRAPTNDALFVADEDHAALVAVALPLGGSEPRRVELPGKPAQALVTSDRVLVSVREVPEGGGALLVFGRRGALELEEPVKVSLPGDAWGIAISPDESLALVSSAWTGRVSAIDLTKASVLWTVEVAREPRGITILPSGDTAYVSHLVGSAVTRLDALRTSAPTVKRIELPAAPLRSPDGARLAASLGYAVTASPEGDRVFFARHALGALGEGVWQGSPSVDVLVPGRDEPLAPARRSSLPQAFVNATAAAALPPPPDAPDPWMSFKKGAVHLDEAFVQPRALAYRRSTRTLLVASEGTNVLVEVDATLSDPLLGVRHRYPLVRDTEPPFGVPRSGGAPSGVALSADEREAFVFNRSTYDVSVVTLVPGEGSWDVLPPRSIPLADDDAPAEVGKGRRLFYDATDATVSGGLGCAGCHPEGRDDGHVWHELVLETTDRDAELAVFLSGPDLSEVGGWWRKVPPRPAGTGYPRQTPMLAGRVGAQGPYGWHGESADLASRITAGFKLHRWGDPPTDAGAASARAGALIAFLRGGLVPPPRDKRALTAEEQMGKAIFESAATQCAKCHVAASDYTDRAVVPVGPVPKKQGFEPEANEAFKTPSLLFVGGTAPYFHDGRFATLEDLVEQNADRMGKTSHLGEKERKALVAFLKTL